MLKILSQERSHTTKPIGSGACVSPFVGFAKLSALLGASGSWIAFMHLGASHLHARDAPCLPVAGPIAKDAAHIFRHAPLLRWRFLFVCLHV